MYSHRTIGVLAAALLIFAAPAFAQESLSVTVTPPLFQLAIVPGESWSSSIKIVNSNRSGIDYYIDPVDFVAEGELGKSRFIPLINDDGSTHNSFSLAQWIEIPRGPIYVPAESSKDVPFTVTVPSDAEPGGHYAAVMIGTSPGRNAAPGSRVSVSSFVSSLMFVRVAGDVIERGRIREFVSDKSLYQEPRADMILRFENIGNTHLRPQGDIIIYNMWGKERGKVLINQEGNFGNVLPNSVRRFQFAWTGEKSLFDIGRYQAIVTLAFGDGQKQNVTATTYFWVIPLVPVSVTLGAFLTIILLVTWFIRRYIRRVLELERVHGGVSLGAIVAPIRTGATDFQNVLTSPSIQVGEMTDTDEVRLTLVQFASKYHLFFLFIGLLIIVAMIVWLYLDAVLVSERSYEISEVIIDGN